MYNSRKIEDLKPYLQYLCKRLIEKCKQHGITIIVTSTVRDQEYQTYCYKQGTGSQLLGPHGYGLAFDVVPVVNGQAIWSNKILWQRIAAIGKGLGLEWGGDWKSRVDCPHFQYVGGLTNDEIRSGKLPNFPPIPTTTASKPAVSEAANKYPMYWYGLINEDGVRMYSLQDMNKLTDRAYKKGDKLTIIGKTNDNSFLKTEVGWINAKKVTVTEKIKG